MVALTAGAIVDMVKRGELNSSSPIMAEIKDRGYCAIQWENLWITKDRCLLVRPTNEAMDKFINLQDYVKSACEQN